MSASLPWYDSTWLQCYWQAHTLVAIHYPSRLAEFESAFDRLRTNPAYRTKAINSLLAADKLEVIKAFISELAVASLEKQEFLSFGRTVKHDQPLFDEFQHELMPFVSSLAGEELEPAYNFLSLYNNLGVCDLHLDAPNAKWTLDICIEQSAPWPIYIAEPNDWPKPSDLTSDWAAQVKQAARFNEHVLTVGDAILFSGSSQWHYRNRIEQRQKSNFCHLLFLHYCPIGSKRLLNPEGWAELFEMPALTDITYQSTGASYLFQL